MNIQTEAVGLFGKLPAHGDFMQRNLSSSFTNVWDDWLQHFIAGTKEQLSEQWLDIYLTSPIWRFVFSPGVIDENIWAGLMMPSVDRVGRYYPLSIIKKLPQDVNPFEFIQSQTAWFKEIEDLALDALDGEIMIDDLMAQLDSITLEYNSDYSPAGYNLDGNSFQFDMEFEEQSISSVTPFLLETTMSKLFQSYSVWQTSGSELIKPSMFTCQGLPEVCKMPAMLNGNWQGYSWQQPYTLNPMQNYR